MSLGMIFVIIGIVGILLSILGLGIESALFRRRQRRLIKEMEAE